MNCPIQVDSKRLLNDNSDIAVKQTEFLTMLFTSANDYIIKIPKNVMLYHGSRMFPRVANQIIKLKSGKIIRACEIAPQLEAGLSEGLVIDLNNTNRLTEEIVDSILTKKAKKFEMMWLNFNWYANRTIAGGWSCKPCKSMMLLKTTQDIYVFNFVRMVSILKKNKNSIERITQNSDEKLYIARKNTKQIYIDTWDNIKNNDSVFTKSFVKKNESIKNSAVSVTNQQFKTSGFSGIGIILAQYQYLRKALGDLNLPPIMGYFDVDFAEGVEMKTENWSKWKNTNKIPTICGCVYDNNYKLEGKKTPTGICPELMIMNPLEIIKCVDVFYTTRNDYMPFIDEEEDIKSDNPSRLSLDNLSQNIIDCVGKENFNINPHFNVADPLDSFINNQAPWFQFK